MKKKKPALIFEQLEERIFLDANPLLILDSDVDPGGDAVLEQVATPLESAAETAAAPIANEQGEIPESADSEGADEPSAPVEGGKSGPEGGGTADPDDSAGAVEGQTSEQVSYTAELAPEDTIEHNVAVVDESANPAAEDAQEFDSQDLQQIDVAEQSLTDQTSPEAVEAAIASDNAPSVAEKPADIFADGQDAESAKDLLAGGPLDDNLSAVLEDPAASEPTYLFLDSNDSGSEIIVLDPLDPLINEDFSFTYSFTNNAADGGSGTLSYGPFVDIYFPTSGLQGDYPDPQPPPPPTSDVYDGINFVSASYEGISLTAVEQVFDATGILDHPYAKDSNGDPWQVTGQEGDTFVTLILPFGSYTPDQPAADINITAHMSNLAEVDQPLDISISSGFAFGLTPPDDPISDPSISNQQTVTTPYLPEVVRFNKEYVGPEGETATGPNYERSYAITIDVANEMTVENLTIVDTLPTNIEFIPGSVSGSLVQSSIWDGTTLIINLGDVTGGLGPEDVVTFDFYVGDIMGPLCDSSEPVVNDMQLVTDWTPFDDRDPFVTLTIDAEVDDNGNISPTPDADEVFEAQPITIQKSSAKEGTGSYAPGDVVVFTLDFQVSDYHALGDIEITDILPDGLTFLVDATHQPGFIIQDQYGNYSGDFTVGIGDEIELLPRPDLSDATQVDVDVSAALIRTGDADGILEGGRTPAGTGGPALGIITYYAVIDDRLTSPDVPVYQGDSFSNSVNISASRYAYGGPDGDQLLTAFPICTIDDADGSSSNVGIPVGSIEKDIYALNGSLVSGLVTVKPGDDVTYRLTYTLPTADQADLVFIDYLPLPIYDVADPDNDPSTTGGWVTQFTAGDINAAIPAAGVSKFGPAETFFPYSTLVPTLTIDSNENSLLYDWAAHSNPAHQGQTVDILFTVTVTNEPFADGLFLTNLVQGTEEGNSGSTSTTDIVQVVLANPELEMVKGVIEVSDNGNTDAVFTDIPGPVGFTDPGSAGFRGEGDITESGVDATPIDADLDLIDAGDLVSFGITVRNVGHFSAYDIIIEDDLPAGFAIPDATEYPLELNLSVTDGAGNTLSFTDGNGNAYGSANFNFFANGIKLTDPLGSNIDADTAQTDNILFISYDLIATAAVQPQQKMTNTGELSNYASIADGPNFVPDPIEDPASVSVKEPTIAKALIGTEVVGSGSGNGVNEIYEAVIGERVYYETSITLQEGTTVNVVLTDQLDRGLELASIDTIVILDENGTARPSGSVISSVWGDNFSSFFPLSDDTSIYLSYTEIENGKSAFSLNLGNLENLDTDNLTDEVVVVSYTAMAVNASTSTTGTQISNAATLSHQALPESGAETVEQGPSSADPVTIIEPRIKVVKTSVVDGVASGPPSQEDDRNDPDFVNGQQGSLVEYTIVVSHRNNSGSTAFDVELLDQLPLQVLPGSLVLTSAIHSSLGELKGTNIFLVGSTLATNDGTSDKPFDLAYGETLTITVNGQLSPLILGGTEIRNEAEIEWTSYQNPVTGAPTPEGSGFVATNDVERTGDPADPGQRNNYNDFDPTLILIQPQSIKYLVNSELTAEPDASATNNYTLAAPDDTDGINNGREVVIGELSYYRIEITVPEALFFDVVIEDQLDPGLALISVDSITLSGDLTAGNIGNDALVDPNNYPFDAPSDTPLNSYITYTYDSAGADTLAIDFGNVFNTVDSNDVDEIITINYTVMATDLPANAGNGPGNPGTQLQNAATISYGDIATYTTKTTGPVLFADTVEIIEPKLEVDKTAQLFTPGSPDVPGAPGDSGDKVVYTITVRHTSETEADAYDLLLTDDFQNTFNTTSLAVDSATITFADNSTQDVITEFSISGGSLQTAAGTVDLPLGAELEVLVSGLLAEALYPADQIENRADLSWTSMDGDRTALSNFVTGDEDRERTETDFAEAPVITVPDPVITKELFETDVTDSANGKFEATIGELVTYKIAITLPEGNTGSAAVIDELSPGLEFYDIVSIQPESINSDISTDLGGGFNSVTGSTSGDAVNGQTVEFSLGNLSVPGDNNGEKPSTVGDDQQGDDRLVILYRAVVVDIAANDAINSAAEIFDNSAKFTYVNNSGGQETASVAADSVTLVEPDLEIIKTVNGLPDQVALANVDAGDTVTYEITIRHTGASGSAAYDTLLSDQLPDEFIFDAVSSVNDSGTLGTAQNRLDTDDFRVTAGNLLQFSIGNNPLAIIYDIWAGREIVVTLTGTLAPSVQPNQDIENTASVDWTSLPSVHPNDGQTNERGLPYTDDIYHDEDIAEISIATPEIRKIGGGTHTIGENTVFEIEVILPEGQIENLVITDDLPDGLQIVGTPTISYASFAGSVVSGAPTITTNTGDGNDITIDYSLVTQPSITVTGDNNPDNNSFFIEITAQVLNIQENVSGDILVNTASLTYLDGNDANQSVGPAVAFTLLVEPQITTTKSVVDESGDQTVARLGEQLTYTATFENTGNATAFETDVEDQLADGTLFRSLDQVLYYDVSAGVQTDISSTTTFNYNNSANILTIGPSGSSTAWNIEESDYIEIVYTAEVQGSWYVPGPHINVIDANWTGLQAPGNSGERIYDDTDTNNPGMSQDGIQDTAIAVYFVPQQSGEIGDRVWFDRNADGVQDPIETGIANVTVTLDGGFGFLATTTTDGNGNYLFSNLQAADYTVSVDATTLPPGMVPTYDYDDQSPPPPPLNTPDTADVALGANESNFEVDFGYNGGAEGRIGDRIWFDANADGVQDDPAQEPGIAYALIRIDGTVGGNPYVNFDFTDQNGNYLFTNLPFLTYTVTVVATPYGLTTQTYDPDGVLDNKSTTTLDETTKPQDLDMDFGYIGGGRVGNQIWDDLNADGLIDVGEPGLAGVNLTLEGDIDRDGAIDFTLQTSSLADGRYYFNGLPTGLLGTNYTITVDDTTLPADYIQSGDPDSILDNTSSLTLSTLTPENLAQDFGYTKVGSIGDLVWYDLNGNGIADAGETGFPGVEITLVGDVDLDGIDETFTTTTDASGLYLFDKQLPGLNGLPLGNYTVTINPATLPAGVNPTYDFDGIATPNTAAVPLGYGENQLDVDFGYIGLGSIGDTIWYDANNNTIQETGEPGLRNVTVTLATDFDGDGLVDFQATTATDDSGKYLFSNLPAAIYTISVDPNTLPNNGFTPSFDLDGIATPHTTQVSLTNGNNRLDVDFGYTGTGSIGDRIWYDQNRNGLQDGGEPGIPGVSVTLQADIDSDGTVDYTASVSTDDNGNYLFDNLPAGNYSLTLDVATIPPSFQQTFDPDGILDSMTVLSLAAGENNLDQDFGYAPPPEQPVVPPEQPVVPPQPPVPPESQVPVPGDPLLAYQFSESAADLMVFPTTEARENLLPPVPISPIFSGIAEPGTTLTLTIYDSERNPVGYQTVIADQSGNWLSNFAGSLLLDTTHQTEIQQTASSMDNSTLGLYNLRTYYNPTMIGLNFSTTRLDAEAIFASTAENVVRSIHQWNNSLLDLDWDQFTGYEFFSPSINPSKHNR